MSFFAPNSPLAIGLRHYPLTLVLMTLCVVLFVIQVLTGVDASSPTTNDLLKWGANAMPLTLDNEPYRMITSLFLHIGLLHLMFNMYALYYFGQVAERMVGSVNFLILFIFSGVGGNLLNNFLALQDVLNGEKIGVSAGASGGIMGIGSALLVIALAKTPVNGMMLNARSLLMVMAINLGYGFLVSGIDNAGHIGGAIMGAILGVMYVLVAKKSAVFLKKSALLWVVYALILGVFGSMYFYLHHQFVLLIA